MWIIQIADLHNSSKYTSTKMKKISDEMIVAINRIVTANEMLVFSICGDILNKGEKVGFADTKDFLSRILNDINTKNVQVVLCPGNHDIVEVEGIKSFNELDKFIFKLNNSSSIRFQNNSVNLKTINNIDFIMINSSYHFNHKYGKIELEKFNNILNKSTNECKIVMLHHHLIPIREGEISTTVNTYEFLKLIEDKNILAILHGHQHMKMEIVIGKNSCKVIGVGSLLTDIEPNYNNQFNMIKIENNRIERIIEFKYHLDELGSCSLGKFVDKNIF